MWVNAPTPYIKFTISIPLIYYYYFPPLELVSHHSMIELGETSLNSTSGAKKKKFPLKNIPEMAT